MPSSGDRKLSLAPPSDKKKGLSLFDAAWRKLKPKQDPRRATLDSDCPRHNSDSELPSPITPYPLPDLPRPPRPPAAVVSAGRTVSCPVSPINFPELAAEDEVFDFKSGSGSTSSTASQESSLSIPGDSLSPSVKVTRADLAGNALPATAYNRKVTEPISPRNSRQEHLKDFTTAHEGRRLYFPTGTNGNNLGFSTLRRAAAVAHLENSIRSSRMSGYRDEVHGNVYNAQRSPDPSLSPSPIWSPGRTPKIQSVVTSPLHPKAVNGGGQDCALLFNDKEVHPLPLPPSVSDGVHVPALPSSVSVTSAPRSPEVVVNFQTGWRKGGLLGSGTFGQVYCGFHSESGQSCAIKEVLIIPDNESSKESANQLMQEVSLLSQMKHPNIVQYYGCEMFEDRLFIYLEFMSNGSIHNIIQQYGPLHESCIRVYTRQILLGLSYLHGKNTVHRDIKGANILVDKGGEVKLADFGMAKHVSDKSFLLSFKGSPYWMAPEVIQNINGYDFAVDIWSLGCTVLEMATGKPPWSDFEGIAAVFKIGNSKEIPFIPDSLSEDAKMFVRNCLQRDPRVRPTAVQLLDHPFVRMDSGVFETLSSPSQIQENICYTGNMHPLKPEPRLLQATTASPATHVGKGTMMHNSSQQNSRNSLMSPRSPRRTDMRLRPIIIGAEQSHFHYSPGSNQRNLHVSVWDDIPAVHASKVGVGESQRMHSPRRMF